MPREIRDESISKDRKLFGGQSVRVTGGCKTKIEALLPKCVRTDMFIF